MSDYFYPLEYLAFDAVENDGLLHTEDDLAIWCVIASLYNEENQ